MEKDRSAKRRLLRKSFIRLAFVNMVVLAATTMYGFIDSVVISKFLGNRALAAVGYFSPLSVVSGLVFVVIVGTTVLCGSYIGSGKQREVNSLFSSSFITIALVSLAFSTFLVLSRTFLSSVLGARAGTAVMLEQYILGFAPSIFFSSLSAYLVALASFNNEIKRSYFATFVTLAGNALLDILLVPLGTFGIGLSSTISCMASLLVMLPVYMKRSRTIHFEKGEFDLTGVFEAVRRGLPSLMFTAGLLIKNSLINYTLITYADDNGIAVAGVMASAYGIVGAITGGFSNAQSTMSSLSQGEEDREAYIDIFDITLKIGMVCTAAVVVLLASFSGKLAAAFFEPGTTAVVLGQRMFMLGFLFFPLNLFINVLMNSYKIQGRMKLVNVLSFVETALIGVIAVFSVPLFGVDAAWLANLWSDIFAAFILMISVFAWKKKVTFSPPDLLKIPDEFGASPEEVSEYTVRSMKEASEGSEAVMAFCKARNVEQKKTLWVGLCIEEVVKNIFQHGSYHNRQNNVSVRVVCKDEISIRIQDDSRKFDPREHMQLFDKETPEKAIGLRMIARIATGVDYYNIAGINTLIVKI